MGRTVLVGRGRLKVLANTAAHQRLAWSTAGCNFDLEKAQESSHLITWRNLLRVTRCNGESHPQPCKTPKGMHCLARTWSSAGGTAGCRVPLSEGFFAHPTEPAVSTERKESSKRRVRAGGQGKRSQLLVPPACKVCNVVFMKAGMAILSLPLKTELYGTQIKLTLQD